MKTLEKNKTFIYYVLMKYDWVCKNQTNSEIKFIILRSYYLDTPIK